MAADVNRNGERVWISGVPSFDEVGNPACTFAASMAATLAVTSHPLSVEDILGLSGYAFHVRWCLHDGKPAGCPGSVSLEQGYLPAAFSAHSGWQLRILLAQGWDHPDMQAAVPDIMASIDAGRPVIIEDRCINASVLYGYVGQGERYLLNTHMDGHIEAGLADLSQDPAYAFLLEGYVEPAPFRDVFRDILSNAIAWWHQEHEPGTCGGDNMRIGRTALEYWAQFYGSIDDIAPAYLRGKGGLLYNSLMNYQHLYENRIAAAGFLSGHSDRFPRAQGAIAKAAEVYREEAQLLGSALDSEDDAWSDINGIRAALIGRAPQSAAWEMARSVGETDVWSPDLGIPFITWVRTNPSVGHADAWTPDVRERERRIMEQALRLETAAIQHLQHAHALLGG